MDIFSFWFNKHISLKLITWEFDTAGESNDGKSDSMIRDKFSWMRSWLPAWLKSRYHDYHNHLNEQSSLGDS